MARFHDLVNQLRNPGDDGPSDSIFDDLTAEYDTFLDGSIASSQAKDTQISELNGEVTRLKAQNYELVMQVSSGTEIVQNDSDDDSDSETTIDSLFKRK